MFYRLLLCLFLFPATLSAQQPVTVTAVVQHVRQDTYRLVIKATVPAGQFIYSINQEDGGPIPTTINVTTTPGVVQQTTWREVPKPLVRRYDFWPNLAVLTQAGKVRWVAEFRSPTPVFQISGEVVVYACSGTTCYNAQTLKFVVNN